MARIAMVESYPYEAVWGGDAVYLDRIREFLIGRGHIVDSYVTDVTRGRTNPLLRLRSKAGRNHRWIVRNALARDERQFLSYDPRLLAKVLTRISGRRALPEYGVREDEERWLIDRLTAARPDLVLLAFGASAFAKALKPLNVPSVALKGFFSDQRIELGSKPSIPSLDKATLDNLRHADCASFNNLQDLDHYRQATKAENGALIGMSFPSRVQGALSDEPIILFVGARTKPNIASLEWFLERVWPIVKNGAPTTQLRVVGTIGSAFAHLQDKQVRLLGFAENLDEEYRRAQAVIAPLIIGSNGVKTKVAEALSYGRPLVTTSLGVDPSNPHQFGEAVDIADRPQAYASALVRLLTDEALRALRAQLAAIEFERHFSEESAYSVLIDMLQQLPDTRTNEAA